MTNSEARKRNQEVLSAAFKEADRQAAVEALRGVLAALRQVADQQYLIAPDFTAMEETWRDLRDAIDDALPGIAVQPCPECRAGKHLNCNGQSWDFVGDELAPCPCATARHGAPC